MSAMFGRTRKHPTSRPAVPGEVCTCGKPAVTVFDHPVLGVPQGSCLDMDPQPRTGPCPFCGITGRHTTEGICPAYTLRPAWAAPAAQTALDHPSSHCGIVHHVAGEVR